MRPNLQCGLGPSYQEKYSLPLQYFRGFQPGIYTMTTFRIKHMCSYQSDSFSVRKKFFLSKKVLTADCKWLEATSNSCQISLPNPCSNEWKWL